MWLFPPQTKYPLCTLAETPRTPVHCIEYVHLIQWPKEHKEDFDVDNAEHLAWTFEKACARAEQFGIQGVTYSLVQGVVKNIIPAIASTNAIIAAACSTEVLKIATMCSGGMNNYMMYMGSQGIYTHTVAYEKDPQCIVCGPGISVSVTAEQTLEHVLGMLSKHASLGGELTAPSISCGSRNLYMQGPLEPETRKNLSKKVSELFEGMHAVISLNDKSLQHPVRVNLKIKYAVKITM